MKTIILMGLMLVTLNSVSQTPGTLDSSFGNGGKVINSMYNDLAANEMTVQDDGKIIVVGDYYVNDGARFVACAFRYNLDGTLDNTFGNNGVALIVNGEPNKTNFAWTVMMQPDGKILIGGTAEVLTSSGFRDQIAINRLNSNGTYDVSFGTEGMIIIPVASTSEGNIYGLSIQQDGKIIGVGRVAVQNGDSNDIVVVRVNPNGTLDNIFSDDGQLTINFTSGTIGSEARIDSNGNIMVAGRGNNELALAHLLPDGSFDPSFGTNGRLMVNLDDVNYIFKISAIPFLPDGKVLVLGSVGDDVAMRRINSDGTIDTSFGENGKVLTDINNGSIDKGRSDLVIEPSGKIIALAESTVSGSRGFATLRYNSEGVLDTTFGNDGVALTDFLPQYSLARAAELQPDGKLIVVGTSAANDVSSIVMARYFTGIVLATTSFAAETAIIYPNPTSSSVFIKSPNDYLSNKTYTVVDQLGRIVMSGNFGNATDHEVDFSNLKAGIYIIDFHTGTFKVVKR